MLCRFGHEMTLEEVETVAAHQQGGEIVDASYQTMYVCTHKDCDEVEIYEKEEPGDNAWDKEEA